MKPLKTKHFFRAGWRRASTALRFTSMTLSNCHAYYPKTQSFTLRQPACLVAIALSLAIMGVFTSVPANAQSAAQAAEIVKSLSSQSQAVVARLTELNQLSAEEWRFHAGDLAHGESFDLA